jgi:hypothetical protein
MSLSYYIPGLRSVGHDQIVAAGLGYAFPAGAPWARVPTANGPDGGGGIVVRVGAGHGTGYYPDRQTWTKAPGDATWWIGVDGETLPEDLLREEVIDGHLVKLGDGNEWLIPTARSFGRGSILPESMVLGPDGETWVGEPLKRFAQISTRAERVELAFRGDLPDDAEPLDMGQEGVDIVVGALSFNYRISALEVSVLRLLTGPIVARCLWALVDGPTLEAVAEEAKREGKGSAGIPGGSSSSDGVEG